MPIGVIINEKDESLYVNSNLVSPILAIVGTATKGPVNVPTLCTSISDFKRKFGSLNTKSFGLYAAQKYLSQVSRLYYMRVADTTTAAPAKVTIPGTKTGSAAITNLVEIETAEVGTFYSGYVVTISDVQDSKFSMAIKSSSNGTLLYNFSNVSLNETDPNYIGTLLNGTFLRLKTIQDTTATVTAGSYNVTGGNNGFENINDEIVASLEKLKSSSYKIDMLSIPGVSEASVVLKGIEVCESRGDALFLVDPPIDLNYAEVVDWVDGAGSYTDHTAFNSSHAACYWSWQYIYDDVNDTEILVPPSVLVAPTIARSESISKPWFAPAGLTRGLVKNALRSEYIPSDSEVDYLYDHNVNSIITHETSGLVVWGQKTLWRQPTALDRVNVRRLVTYIKRIVKNTCQFLVYEPNDSTTWYQFEDLLKPVFRSLVSTRGLYDFKIVPMKYTVSADDIDNSRMPAQILIKPTKSAEYIPITLVLTATGVEFSDVIQETVE